MLISGTIQKSKWGFSSATQCFCVREDCHWGCFSQKKRQFFVRRQFCYLGGIADAQHIFPCRATGAMGRYKWQLYVSVVEKYTKVKTVSEFDRKPRNYFRCPSNRPSQPLWLMHNKGKPYAVVWEGTWVLKAGRVTWHRGWCWLFTFIPETSLGCWGGEREAVIAVGSMCEGREG